MPVGLEARLNGRTREIRIVLHAGKALFLGGVLNAPVDDERCAASW